MDKKQRLKIIEKSSKQVGSGVFYSTIVVIASFLPVFMLTGIEGKLFHPLAWTKTFILLIDAFLAISLAPVLISFFLKGNLKSESVNPVTRILEKIYLPIISWYLNWRKTVLTINIIALLIGIAMMFKMGLEFMPPLDEGSILFMSVTLPDVSNSEVKRIIQVQKFIQPIINRINMLSTGIRTDVGLKIYGQNLDSIYLLATKIKKKLEGIAGRRIEKRIWLKNGKNEIVNFL